MVVFDSLLSSRRLDFSLILYALVSLYCSFVPVRDMYKRSGSTIIGIRSMCADSITSVRHIVCASGVAGQTDATV